LRAAGEALEDERPGAAHQGVVTTRTPGWWVSSDACAGRPLSRDLGSPRTGARQRPTVFGLI